LCGATNLKMAKWHGMIIQRDRPRTSHTDGNGVIVEGLIREDGRIKVNEVTELTGFAKCAVPEIKDLNFCEVILYICILSHIVISLSLFWFRPCAACHSVKSSNHYMFRPELAILKC
jgi:hypothetical protein